MKISKINSVAEKLKEQKNAILELIDIKVDQEIEGFQAEIKALNYKLATLTWFMVVIVLGFLAKLVFGS